eukprot:jgi/Undpi1/9741/HiC_scaffold_27.g12197.m1
MGAGADSGVVTDGMIQCTAVTLGVDAALYSGKLKRKPGVFTRASGIIRVRPMSQAEEGRELPASSRLWPKLASFAMNLDLPEKFRHRKRPDRGEDGGDDKILRK